ncbi:polysaccharide deacetylase family protein [Halalkalibacter krulwichiae]|uniref:Peptidoglycan-N-acetylglucosamine deacetylase n=1 Tax=Halalkalibacter krulwichiae TaxID=199441 RepID=A0A1X9MDA1_9BACI|nr:polysaccharide deacetylase family protein [Halalkalibacter krulwichiae]ARK30614.1 Peptidoglycan-N-acetylglucosamine deacetylase [Halalkalibacter krulwichiae]
MKKEGKNEVLLTFDDGPSKYLDQFLDVLAEEKVPALFFWQSRLLHHKRPWSRVLREGHEIGLHSHSHKNLVKLTKSEQMKEIKTNKRIVEQLIDHPVRYFRPPFGQHNSDTIEIASELDLEVIMWDISSFDWDLKDDPTQIVKNVTEHVQDGSIILLHELKQTLEILPQLIQGLKERGCHFTSLKR